MYFMNHKPGKQMQAQAVRPCVITKRQPAAEWQAQATERPEGNDTINTP